MSDNVMTFVETHNHLQERKNQWSPKNEESMAIRYIYCRFSGGVWERLVKSAKKARYMSWENKT